MGTGNPLQPYNYNTRTNKNIFDDYRVNQTILNHSGKYSRVDKIPLAILSSGSLFPSASITDYSGSNFGATAIYIATSGVNATASLSGGGTMELSGLPTGIHEDLAISRVETNDTSKFVYILIQEGTL